jgi:hypothetical protein
LSSNNLACEQAILELTYDSPKMRTIAADTTAAHRVLGPELAEAFFSLVADMRNAMYLGELLDGPIAIQPQPLLLEFVLAPGSTLEVQPVGTRAIDTTNWSDAHRVKLVRIIRNGVNIL